MQDLKLNLAIARFPYGGNGGSAVESPNVADWLVGTILDAKKDPRIGEIFAWKKSDTPISMVRNDAVYSTRNMGADLLLMIDSDMFPDYELERGDKTAKPFWDVAFNFVHERYKRGLITVIGAPYCGPPPNEAVYIFRWCNYQSEHPGPDCRLEMYSREEAAIRAGIEEVAALPTGLILFDMRAFDLLAPPYHYYEFEDGYERSKASTEDVTITRDISMHCCLKHGYNPLFVAWDSWAGHWKPKCVGKPRPIFADQVSEKYREAVLRNHKSGETLIHLRDGLPNGSHRHAKNQEANGQADLQGARPGHADAPVAGCGGKRD